MVEGHKIWGRIGNQLFLMAAHYARAKRENIHFFVQDEKYFADAANDIKALFSQGIEPNSVKRVAIHRRLGDYKGNTFYVDLGHHDHENLDENYYMRAMTLFPEGTKYTVFSDQIEIAKKEPMFQGEQFEFSEGRTDIEDLNYMANHQHIIGANSSFSWWAAWLGEYPGRKMIFPKKWFGDSEHDKYIGVPERWLRI